MDSYVGVDYANGELNSSEIFWRDHQKWLESCGYMLRPRYKPDWVPSWKDSKDKDWILSEDGRPFMVRRANVHAHCDC